MPEQPKFITTISLFPQEEARNQRAIKLSWRTWWGRGRVRVGRWAVSWALSVPPWDSDTPSAIQDLGSVTSASVSRTQGSVSPCLKWRGRCDYQVNDNMSGPPSWGIHLGDLRMSPRHWDPEKVNGSGEDALARPDLLRVPRCPAGLTLVPGSHTTRPPDPRHCEVPAPR